MKYEALREMIGDVSFAMSYLDKHGMYDAVLVEMIEEAVNKYSTVRLAQVTYGLHRWMLDKFGWEGAQFHKLVENESYRRALAALLSRVPQDLVNYAAFVTQLSWYLAAYEHAGSHAYSCGVGLAKQLADTELHGVEGEILTLPFESILLEIPKYLNLEIWNKDSGFHVTTHAILVQSKIENGKRWNIALFGESKTDDPTDDAIFYFDLPLPDDVQVLDALDKKLATFTGVPDEFKVKLRRTFCWIMNVIIYATHQSAEIDEYFRNVEYRKLKERISKLPKSKKRDKLSAKLKSLDPQRCMLLGKSVVYVTREEAERSVAKGTGKKPTVVSRVAGHWKRQAHGPQRALRKVIFVQPYWRNLDGLPVPAPAHVIK